MSSTDPIRPQMPQREPSGAPGYGGLAKFLHWTIATLIAAQFALGWSMPHIGRNTRPGTLINLHFSVGMVILLLVIVRLAWRLTHPVPPVTTNVPLWQQRTARVVHLLFYVLLLAIPVLGWMSASGRNFPVALFGVIQFPQLLPAKHPWTGTLGDIHTLLSNYVLLGAVALHGLAALYHHFIVRDETLRRMLPRVG